MRVVCVAGMPGCGKEEFLKAAEKRGFAVVRMGDVVREEAARRGVQMTELAVGTFADQERKEYGYGIWAVRTAPRVTHDQSLIDGIRSPAEIEVYRSAFQGNLFVVAIHASPATRLSRIMRRRRRDDSASKTDFEARDTRELSWGLGRVIALADFMIVNESGLGDFRMKAAAILDRIVSGRT